MSLSLDTTSNGLPASLGMRWATKRVDLDDSLVLKFICGWLMAALAEPEKSMLSLTDLEARFWITSELQVFVS